MFEKDFFVSLKKATPYLALGTIVAYTWTVLLQLGYLIAFGVDPFLVTPRVDPASLLLVSIVVFMLLYTWAILKGVEWLKQSKSFYVAVAVDLVIASVIVVAIFGVAGFIKGGPYSDLSSAQWNWFWVAVFALAFTTRVFGLIATVRAGKKWKQKYVETSFLKVERLEGGLLSKQVNKVAMWIGRTITLLVITLILPSVTGYSFAQSKQYFSQILPDKETKNIVIGQSNEGYIIKKYDSENGTFKSGWFIIKQDRVEFGTTKVKSLQEKK